jgi:nucleoside-diphosphate-sugar epimerase
MSSLDVTSRPTLIVGCGYLGRRVARRWLSEGRRVTALTRGNADALTALGVEPIIGDVLDPDSLRRLPQAGTVLYAVGLDRSAGRSMRDVYVTGLANILSTLSHSGRFIYVSSTSVYGQRNGELVDERSIAEPTEESGRVVLEAERILRAKRPDAIILRFGGIYGPDRLLRRQGQLRSGEPMSGDAERWLNLIHVEDGADAVLAAESRGEPSETYNIVDDEPVMREVYYERLAELVSAPAPRFDRQPDERHANRRVSNTKAKANLGWRPRYTSYREGLPEALRETTIE